MEIRATLESGGRRRIRGKLTTEHRTSQYGQPVFVEDTGGVAVRRGELLGAWALVVRPEDAAEARRHPVWGSLVREGEP